MADFKAVVKDGRAVIENLEAFPDGTELHLGLADPGDDLDDEERERLHASLDRAHAQLLGGLVTKVCPALPRSGVLW